MHGVVSRSLRPKVCKSWPCSGNNVAVYFSAPELPQSVAKTFLGCGALPRSWQDAADAGAFFVNSCEPRQWVCNEHVEQRRNRDPASSHVAVRCSQASLAVRVLPPAKL